jgi:hypothetical protein
MKFMESISDQTRQAIQTKCPHSRLLMNNPLILEISLKLVIQYIKTSNQQSNLAIDKLKAEK